MSAGEHESLIKTPRQLITVVVLSFIVPVLVIIFLTQLVTGGLRAPGETASDVDDVRERIRPVAMVAIGAATGGAAAAPRSGEAVFTSACVACHAANSAIPAAPRLGDKAAWGKLIKEGLPHLTEIAIKGIRGMPPRGGNPNLSDIEIARAIAYMANQSGGNWKEPEAPKPAAAAEAKK